MFKWHKLDCTIEVPPRISCSFRGNKCHDWGTSIYYVQAEIAVAVRVFIIFFSLKNNQSECRRQALLEHFGENFNRTKCREGRSPCDNCLKMST